MGIKLALGDITVHSVVEHEAPYFDPAVFFPTLAKDRLDENRSWMQPRYLDPVTGKLVLAIQSYVVKTKHHTILVDSCVGNHKERPTFPFWSMTSHDAFERGLKEAGTSFAGIDFVMCTHLHIDHVGWNTRLDIGRWVPTFPNAKYLFADRELEFWTAKEKTEPQVCPWITDSVLPIVAAKQAQVIKSDHEMNDLVRCIPTPGHSIDHFSVHIGKPGADAVLTGDMIHSPLQARYPELGMRADYDSKQAGESRRAVFGRFADTSTLFCTAHFPTPSVGRFTRWDDGFRFVEGR